MRFALLAVLVLASCTDPAPSTPPAEPVWQYGPSCVNDTGSCGVPAGPARTAEGVVIDVPVDPSPLSVDSRGPHINYVTFRHGSLAGKSQIRIRFRVEAPEGSPIRATKPRGEVWDGKLWLYFERAGNNFTGGPDQNWYRWWALGSETRLHNGEYEVTARFDEPWGAVSYGGNYCVDTTAANDPDCRGPAMFQAALANADRVGFTLGGGDGKGHGVDADGPGARIVVVSFEVE